MTDAFTEIRSWLNSKRDYTAGVKLYCKYGDIESLKQLLLNGPTTELKQKLFDRLKEIYSRIKAKQSLEVPTLISEAPIILPKENSRTTVQVNHSEQNKYRDSDEWKSLDQKKSRLYNEMVMYFNQLDLMKDESPECCNACLRILELEDDYEHVRLQMKHFEATGELPAAPAPIPEAEENAARKRLMQLRPNITKAKKRILTLEGDKLNKKKLQLAEWERECDELEKKLGIEKRTV